MGDGIPLGLNSGCGRAIHVAGRGMGMRGGAVCHMSAISVGGQGVGLVDEVAEGALQFQGFGGEGEGGVNGAGELVPQRVDAGGGRREFLAPDALHFDQPSRAHWGDQRPRKYDTLMDRPL